MQAYQSGDEQAFECLYERYSGRVYAYLKRRLSRQEEVDDVFQAVFLKVHASRSGYRSEFLFAQWLFVITKTVFMDHLRKKARTREDQKLPEELNAYAAAAAELVPGGPTPLALREQLTGLNDDQRAIVMARVFDEQSFREIAQALGRSEVSVRQVLSRALKKLRGVKNHDEA